MFRRLPLVALIVLLGATTLAPQPACAAPEMSAQSAMACCRMMKRCTTAGTGHRCCRRVHGDHEQPSGTAVAAMLPTRLTQATQALSATQLATTGEPSASVVPSAPAWRVASPLNPSRPGPAVPVYILLDTLLI